jgi:hypothetical protein
VDIRVAKSIVDYVFRWFGKKFLYDGAVGGRGGSSRRWPPENLPVDGLWRMEPV